MPQPKQKSTPKKTAATKPKTATKPAARKPTRKPRATSAKVSDRALVAALEELRDEIARSFTLTAERVQETFDESVSRGRLTRTDAERLADSLLDVVRRQRKELIDDLEAVLDRGAAALSDAAANVRRRAHDTVGATAKGARRTQVGDRAMREVDRARRATGLARFPITGYDQLTVSQVLGRLSGLAPADLRKVRQYELGNANRKSVLAALDKRLSS